MENSPISLVKWFRCIYLIATRRGISSIDLADEIGVRQGTAWFMMQRLTASLTSDDNIILSGIVEADETAIAPLIHRNKRLKVAKQKHDAKQNEIHGPSDYIKRKQRGAPAKRGRKIGSTKEVLERKQEEKALLGERKMYEKGYQLLGMVERGGRIVLRILGESRSDVTQENIFPHFVKHIAKESILMTDQHVLYDKTEAMFKKHYTINHSIEYVKKEDDFKIHTNGIEGAWKSLKKMIRGKHVHFSLHHANRYLSLFAYRWNRRQEGNKVLFDDFIPNLFNKRFKYRELTYKQLTCQGHTKQAA